MRAVRGGLLDEELRVVPLAHQAAVVIGEADDDGLDLAAVDAASRSWSSVSVPFGCFSLDVMDTSVYR